MMTVRTVVSAAALALFAHGVCAQSGYPTRPVRIIVPSAAAGGADTMARILAPPLAERLGQQVVVDARPGAGTIVGTEAVARAAADGYTLLVGVPALAINPSIYKTLPYDGLHDFAAITQAVNQPNMFVVHPSLPAQSVKALIALARARPTNSCLRRRASARAPT